MHFLTGIFVSRHNRKHRKNGETTSASQLEGNTIFFNRTCEFWKIPRKFGGKVNIVGTARNCYSVRLRMILSWLEVCHLAWATRVSLADELPV